MAGQTIDMSILKQVIRHRVNGVALQTIAKAVGISRNTVKKYLRLIEVKQLNSHDLLQLDDPALDMLLQDPDPDEEQRYQTLASMFTYIESELKRPGVTRWILWGEYRELHPGGYSYSQFCDHYRAWTTSRSGTLHIEQEPADKLYIDFTGKKLPIVDSANGQVSEAEVFVAILGYSQLTYVEATYSQKNEMLIQATENAFHYFGGVTMVIFPDNLKSAVTKASNYEADINSSFMDFANHYKTSVLPARARKPRDKALVEKAVSIVYSRIFAPLRNQVFFSLASLNQAIRELLHKHNNQRFQQRPWTRQEMFDTKEKHLLSPLPSTRFELKIIKKATVMKNGYVQIFEDKHYYSVPYRFIGKEIKLIYTASQVSVFYNKERIAYHKRSLSQFSYTTTRDHLSSAHQFVSQWNPEFFTTWAGKVDSSVKNYIITILTKATYPETAYRTCVGILSYEKKVGKERLIKAVERATFYGIFNYTIITRILKAGLDQIPFADEVTVQSTLPFHDNIRGAQEYQ